MSAFSNLECLAGWKEKKEKLLFYEEKKFKKKNKNTSWCHGLGFTGLKGK